MRRIAIMCSGGLKSSWLCELAAKETNYEADHLILVFFEHFQKNLQGEHSAVQYLKEKYRAELLTIPFHYNNFYTADSVWPIFKFTSMLYLSLAIARDHKCELFYCGMSKDELEPVYEHTIDYIRTLQGTLSIIQPRYDADGFLLPQIEVEIPLAYLDYKRVVRLGNEWGVEWSKTWSCETNSATIQCGKCIKCVQRQKAFEAARIKDPTVYLQPSVTHSPPLRVMDASELGRDW